MKGIERNGRVRRAGLAAVAMVVAAAACAHGDIAPPAAAEFGLGPRASETGMYTATVEPVEPISVRKLHGWTLRVAAADGAAVTGARITVDGGMPQHGHGLPTRPRVTGELGDGAYQVEGMRFNMGGWWVVTFDIHGPAGDDRVTFNLDL